MTFDRSDRALLRLARGGISLPKDTPAYRRALSLEKRGALKEVADSERGRAFKLSGEGLSIAYDAGAL
jgi:hypothetical protein